MDHKHRKCPLCNYQGDFIFTAKILKKYEVRYYKCSNCKMIYTEEPFWLEEAYDRAITAADTGAILRNIHNSIKVKEILNAFFPDCGQVLDWGGGYGVFTRMMRDGGTDCLWYDKYATNLMAYGFEWDQQPVGLLMAFEVAEHMSNPREDFEAMFSVSRNILLSTTLYKNDKYPDKTWWYYSRECGQHIAIYNLETMDCIAKTHGVNYFNIAGLHLFSEQKLSEVELQVVQDRINNKIETVNRVLEMSYSNSKKDMEYILKQ